MARTRSIGHACFGALVAMMVSLVPTEASAQVVIQQGGSFSSEDQAAFQQQRPAGSTPNASATPASAPTPAPVAASPAATEATAPPPTQVIHHSDPIPGLIIGGLAGLLGGWVVDLLTVAYCEDADCGQPYYDNALSYGWIPLIGPWLQLTGPHDLHEFVIVLGIVQAAGAVALALGFVITDEWDEPVYSFDRTNPLAPTLHVAFAPTPHGGAGSATLRF